MAQFNDGYELPKSRRGALRLISSGTDFSTMQLTKLTRQDLAWFKLARKGADLGARELPPSNSIGPSLHELGATRYSRDLVDRCASLCMEDLAVQIKTVAECALTPDDMSFTGLVNKAHDEVNVEKIEANQDYVECTKARDNAERQLNWFRTRHELPEDSQHGKSLAVWAGALAACAVVEALPNSFVLGEGDALGPLGGTTFAGTLGVMSSFAGALMAFGLRDLKFKTWLSSTSGLTQLTLGFALSLALAVLAAHLRHGLQVDAANAVEIAANTLRQGLLPPSIDLKGAGMLGWTALWTIASFAKTRDTFGAIPGYRRKWIALDRASAALDRLRRDFVALMEDLRGHIYEAIASKEKVASDKVNMAVAAHGAAVKAVTQYDAWIMALDDLHGAALLSFRETNVAVRQTPPPAHFHSVQPLNAPALRIEPAFDAAVDAIKVGYAQVQQRAQEAREEIDRVIREALEWIGAAPPRANSPVPPLLGGPYAAGAA